MTLMVVPPADPVLDLDTLLCCTCRIHGPLAMATLPDLEYLCYM